MAELKSVSLFLEESGHFDTKKEEGYKGLFWRKNGLPRLHFK